MRSLEERAQARLEELNRELMVGKQRLQKLEEESLAVQQTLLRISGAIQVLEEVLDVERPPTTSGPADQDETRAAVPDLVEAAGG